MLSMRRVRSTVEASLVCPNCSSSTSTPSSGSVIEPPRCRARGVDLRKQYTAALRDFDSTYVRVGSSATERRTDYLLGNICYTTLAPCGRVFTAPADRAA